MVKVRKILITGGAGFIGANFVIYMLKKYPDYKILNYDKLTYAADLNYLKKVEDNKNYFFVKGDICNKRLVEETIIENQIDSIIHFAAETFVDKSIENPSQFIKSNVVGTQILLDIAKKYDLRFHYISTDEVYGSLDFKEKSFNEYSVRDPQNPYSLSKAAADMLVEMYFKMYGVRTTITNCSNNYGAFQNKEKLIPKVIYNSIHDIDIPIYGNGRNVRDWLYVEDHCRAVDKVFHEGKIGEKYCVGGESEKENIEVVKIILKYFPHSKSKIIFVEDRKNHDLRYSIDYSKIRKELNWEPKIVFEEGIKKTIDYFRNVYKNK